jgi:hypothetical protein
LQVSAVNTRGDEAGWVKLPGEDGIHIADVVEDIDSEVTGGVEIFPMGSKVYQSALQEQITVTGSGFKSGMEFALDPDLKEGLDYDLEINSKNKATLRLKAGRKWRQDAGFIIAKAIKLDKKNYPLAGVDGIRIAVVLTDPSIKAGADSFHETQSKVISIQGHGFTNVADTKIIIRPTSPGAYRVLAVLEDTMRIQLKQGFDWLPSFLSLGEGDENKKIPLQVTGLDTGAGEVVFDDPITVGFVIKDRTGVVCDDSCEFSFDAFKIPEVPEEEPVEGEEGAPPKPPPKPQPLVVENCMRDKRLKFFGIPKLGSYLAVPVVYQTLDHVEGVVVGVTEPPPVDPENPDAPVVLPETTYTAAKVPCSILLGLDTVGEYRTFKPHEISTAVSVGDALAATLEAIEAKMFENHVQFLQGHAAVGEAIAAILAAVATEEAAALETVALQLAPPPVDPDAPPADPPVEPEPVPETLKPYSEAVAVLKVWSSEAGLGAPAYAAALSSMQNHVLPAPPAVCNLMFALGLFLGLAPACLKDACGDVTWEALRTVSSHSPSYHFFGPLFSFSLLASHSSSLPLLPLPLVL